MTDKKNNNIKQIKEISELLVKKQLKEIHFEDEKTSIRVVAHSSEVPVLAPAPVATPTAAPAVAAEPTAEVKSETASGTPITAPIVGTAYLAPSPDASPFVKVGQSVKSGDVIMIIEAMKNMNEIQSTATGTIVDICVEDGQPVEFGEKLVVIE